MKEILTAKQMKQSDLSTMDMGLSSAVLMERAALAVLEQIGHCGYDTSRVCVVCGTGNNGGDGAAIARILAERGKKPVLVYTGNPDKRSEMCALQAKIASTYEIQVKEKIEPGRYSLVIDAMFGIGLSREITGLFAERIDQINRAGCPVVAVDIPSGIHTDTGAVMGSAVKADLTVTFARGKNGLFLAPGCLYAGIVKICEIGIPVRSHIIYEAENQHLFHVEASDFKGLPARDPLGNKGTFGKVLVIAGSAEMFGAAYLSAYAALLSGVGMVRVFTARENRQALSSLLPECLMTFYDPQAFQKELLVSALKWADSVIVGPGLGKGIAAREILQTLTETSSLPTVMDADACNLLAEDASVWEKIHFPAILTPHAGEMSRLCGTSIAEIKESPLQTAEEFARKNKVICVLKDARTVIAGPDGCTYLNLSGNDSLATAGSGDVLAGIVGGFMTRYGYSAETAAMAVHLHGACGESAGERLGNASVTARDLLTELPVQFRNLLITSH